jgi:hypothetical protein
MSHPACASRADSSTLSYVRLISRQKQRKWGSICGAVSDLGGLLGLAGLLLSLLCLLGSRVLVAVVRCHV